MTKGIPELSDPSIGGEFTNYIGLQFTELTGDLVVATWTAGPHLHQPHGIVHGGAHCSVVETLASMGGTVWLGEKGRVVGVNNNTDFLRAISSGTVTAVSTPIHRGRRQQLWLITITDDNDRLVARGQVRLQNMPAQ